MGVVRARRSAVAPGEDDIGALSGLDTSVAAKDEIAIIPAIAGG